ncbi:hypothetical protein A2U01_0008954, partial [Trifolium medium]|nr:hypothetical protein [Trifolium medium]
NYARAPLPVTCAPRSPQCLPQKRAANCAPRPGSCASRILRLLVTEISRHTPQRDPPPNHLCQEDFRYKEPVESFVEPSALIPLLGHKGAARGITHVWA